jgi:hypothetical protein
VNTETSRSCAIRTRLAAILLAAFSVAGPCLASTIGQPLVRRQNHTETNPGGFLFIYNTPINVSAVGIVITRWGIYSASNSRDITPVLYRHSLSLNSFEIIAIGTTRRSTTTSAAQWFDFSAVYGSPDLFPVTGYDYYVGWKDGTRTTGNRGAIRYTNQGQNNPSYAGGVYLRSHNSNITIALGNQYNRSVFDAFNRDYSIEFEYDSLPETSTFFLIGGGIVSLAALKRRQRRI